MHHFNHILNDLIFDPRSEIINVCQCKQHQTEINIELASVLFSHINGIFILF